MCVCLHGENMCEIAAVHWKQSLLFAYLLDLLERLVIAHQAPPSCLHPFLDRCIVAGLMERERINERESERDRAV